MRSSPAGFTTVLKACAALLVGLVSTFPLHSQQNVFPDPNSGLRGQVSEVMVESKDANGSVVESQHLVVAAGGKLTLAEIERPGASAQSIRYEYSRLDLAKRQLDADAFKPKKDIIFPETGNFQGVGISAPGKNLVCERVFDNASSEPSPISQDLCFEANGTHDLNEIMRLNPDNLDMSWTYLNLGEQRLASWWILRDKKGKVRADHMLYADLSFDRRIFHRDGTVEGRSFRTSTREFESKSWDATGKLVRITVSLPERPSETRRLEYDSRGRLARLSEQSGVHGTKSVVEFTYIDDAQGNWIERRASRNGSTVETVTRTIHYRADSEGQRSSVGGN